MESIGDFDAIILSEEPKSDNASEGQQYEPKVCESKWFFKEDTSHPESVGYLVAQADLHYYQGRWPEAIELYLEGRRILGDKSPLLKRITLESIARCYLKLGDYKAAYVWAHKLLDFNQSNEHKVVAHNLVSIICHELDDFREEADHLRFCLSRLPLNGIHWFHLGQCYVSVATDRDSESSSTLDPSCTTCAHLHYMAGDRKKSHFHSEYCQLHSACHHDNGLSVSDHDHELDECTTRIEQMQCNAESVRTKSRTYDKTIGSYLGLGRGVHPQKMVTAMCEVEGCQLEMKLTDRTRRNDKEKGRTSQLNTPANPEIRESQLGTEKHDANECERCGRTVGEAASLVNQNMGVKSAGISCKGEGGSNATGTSLNEEVEIPLLRGSCSHSGKKVDDIESTEWGQQKRGFVTNGGIQKETRGVNGRVLSGEDTVCADRVEQSMRVGRGGDSEEIRHPHPHDQPTAKNDILRTNNGRRDSHDGANMSCQRSDSADGRSPESRGERDVISGRSDYYKYALICYIRARILLKPVTSLCNNRHQRTLSKVKEHLEALGFPEQFVSSVSQLCWKRQFGIDQKQGIADGKMTSLTANGEYIESAFENYWFEGILEHTNSSLLS